MPTQKLEDVAVNDDELLNALAELAPKDKTPPSLPSEPDTKKNTQSKSRTKLGKLDLERYLNHYGVLYNVKHDGPRTIYRLEECLFDPTHGKNEASIIQVDGDPLRYQCFHDHCRHTWKDAREKISGKDSLAQFQEGYDPNWKPPHRGPARPAPAEASGAPPGGPKTPVDRPFLSVSAKGRITFNPSLFADFLFEEFKPIVNEGKHCGSLFYHYDKAGYWKILPESTIRRAALKALGEEAKTARITDTVTLLEDLSFIEPEILQPDPMWINLKNCMLYLPTMETAPHDPRFNSRVQMPVTYNPEAKCTKWISSLIEIFLDDTDKIYTMQDFFGYCLYPKIIFPCALFQIGSGSNGKGTVQRVLEDMLGEQNVSHISLKRMEDKFGPIELKDKLLNACGETATEPLQVTQFKAIAAGDRMQAEVKYKQDVKFLPIAKHMISMNEFPGVPDKTDAFFRRLIVMEYKTKFSGQDDDKDLPKKLHEELDGIFIWALEGLKRVLERKEMTMPESTIKAKKRFRARVNPVLSFVDEICDLGEAYTSSPPVVYKTYKAWCEDGQTKPLGKVRFYEQLETNFTVTRDRPPGSTIEVFRGLGLKEGIEIKKDGSFDFK